MFFVHGLMILGLFVPSSGICSRESEISNPDNIVVILIASFQISFILLRNEGEICYTAFMGICEEMNLCYGSFWIPIQIQDHGIRKHVRKDSDGFFVLGHGSIIQILVPVSNFKNINGVVISPDSP
jgi:hypothetical protein